jgi:uncharacterized protein YjbJ (UPF0337 family)
MNKTRVQGTIDEVVGSAKRKAGEFTGNTTLQVKGIVQQATGQVETTIGKAKEALCDVVHDTEVHLDAHVKLAARNSTANANVSTTATAPNSKPATRTA